MANGTKIKQKVINNLVQRVHEAFKQQRGIFYGGLQTIRRRFLPQWDLPPELEHNPQQDTPKDKLKASQYLLSAVMFERLAQSRVLHKGFREIWRSDPWFFNPEDVLLAPQDILDNIIKTKLRYNLPDNHGKPPAAIYYHNAEILARHYGSDPRRIIEGVTAREARQRLMEFNGIGPGIANLAIIQLADRNLAYPIDPENARPKIDTHKGGIPLRVGAVKLPEGKEAIHASSLREKLEDAYCKACRKYGLDIKLTDALIWIVGTAGCSRQDYEWCNYINCPLLGICRANTPLNGETGQYQLLREGKLVDRNSNADTQYLPIYHEIPIDPFAHLDKPSPLETPKKKEIIPDNNLELFSYNSSP